MICRWGSAPRVGARLCRGEFVLVEESQSEPSGPFCAQSMKPAAEGRATPGRSRPVAAKVESMSGELVMERFRLLERIGGGWHGGRLPRVRRAPPARRRGEGGRRGRSRARAARGPGRRPAQPSRDRHRVRARPPKRPRSAGQRAGPRDARSAGCSPPTRSRIARSPRSAPTSARRSPTPTPTASFTET